jgi:hypothetical protein
MADSEAMQQELDLVNKTVSLWTYIHHKDNFYRFTNPLYSPPVSSSTLGSKTPITLIPKCSVFALGFWSNSYLQGANFRDRTLEMSMERAFEMNCKIEDLELRIAELEFENSVLKGIPILSTTSSASSSLNRTHSPPSLVSPRSTSHSSSAAKASGVSKSSSAMNTVDPRGDDEDIETDVILDEDLSAIPREKLQAHRASGDMALDRIVEDLTRVGEASHRSLAPFFPANPAHLTFSEDALLDSMEESDPEVSSPSPRIVMAPSAVHPTSFKKGPLASAAPSNLVSNYTPPPPSSITPEPAASPSDVDLAAPPTLYVDDEIDWSEALSMDAPKVRGCPDWGSSTMMIEDYTGQNSAKTDEMPNPEKIANQDDNILPTWPF